MTGPGAAQAIAESRVSGLLSTIAAAVVSAVVVPLTAAPHFTIVPGKVRDEVIDASNYSYAGHLIDSVSGVCNRLIVFQLSAAIEKTQMR